jgi:photosystem II stability/assembly factor-like uncharacterized protein
VVDTIWSEPQFIQIFDFKGLSDGTIVSCGEAFLNFGSNPDSVGAIFKSYDGGETWEKKATNLAFPQLRKVQFLGNVGYAVGNRSCVLKTSNNGETWEKLSIPYQFPIEINDLHFFTQNHGILLPEAPNFTSTLLFETFNGGLDWETRTYGFNELGTKSLFFVDSLTGYTTAGPLLNERKIFKTIDGGKTWNVDFNKDSTVSTIYSIFFTDTLNGWACATGGRVYSTTNNNGNWKTQREGGPPFSIPGFTYLFKVFFKSNEIGWIAGAKGTILTTENGGENWRIVSSVYENRIAGTPEYILRSIYLKQNNELWVSGGISAQRGGRILKCNLNQAAPVCLNSNPEILNDDPDSTSVFPTFTWSPLDTGCFDGYYLNIGTTPGAMDVLAYKNASTDTFITITKALPYETTLYATILPYNCAKVGEGCQSLEITTQACPEIEIFIDTTLNQGDTFLSSILANDTLITEVLQTPLGCDSTINYLVTVKPVSTKDIHDLADHLLIFPNPAKDQIHFELTNNEKIQLARLYTQSGKELNTTVLNGQHRGTIDIKAFPSGIYYLQIISSNQSITKKIMIN